jgi:hypothetical protein
VAARSESLKGQEKATYRHFAGRLGLSNASILSI